MCAKNTKISAACGRFSGISRDMFRPLDGEVEPLYNGPQQRNGARTLAMSGLAPFLICKGGLAFGRGRI